MMKKTKLLLILATMLIGTTAGAQELTALSCNDFRPTPEAIERFPNLAGACEGIVERDGELFGLFRAVVRRTTHRSVTLRLPATGKTFVVHPDPSHRVVVDGRKIRIRDLARGQEIKIYLAVNEFAKPDIEQVAFVTEANFLVDLEVEEVAELPTTASLWPAITMAGFLLLGASYLLRRRRFRAGLSCLMFLSVTLMAGAPIADAQTQSVQKPGRVVTSTVRSAAIVEAVDKETRELKVIDASGNRFTIAVDDLVANFDQIEPRDRIVVEYLESIAIVVVPAGTPAMGEGMAVELAPLGGKPGITGVETFVVSATVESLNLSDRIATLRYEDGTTRTIKVADDVPLDLVDVGDEVRFRITEAVAISVRQADKT
jgi:LPXTG-motif cell wall-anchored protein